MHEEQDTCRICSAPGEPEQPLFYPCKCSGTIRYIHQDCLTTWLAHSKKKTCDVCKHPYSFTKVYSPNMPKRLPVVLLIRQLSRQALSAALFGVRAVLVGSIWLAFLPWVTIWTWRAYFAVGETFAWWISARPRPHPPGRNYTLFLANSTDAARNATVATPSHDPLQSSMLRHPLLRSITSDIVAGQIIASLIVLTFVAVFLLREWISQNARPGVFEDVDGLAEGDEPFPPEPVPDEQPQPQPHDQPEPARPHGLDFAQLREVREEEGLKRPEAYQLEDDSHSRIRKKPRRASDAPEPEWLQAASTSTSSKGKALDRGETQERQVRDDHARGTEEYALQQQGQGSRRRRRLPSADSTVYGGSDADEQYMHTPSARTIRHWRKRARREMQEQEAKTKANDVDVHPGSSDDTDWGTEPLLDAERDVRMDTQTKSLLEQHEESVRQQRLEEVAAETFGIRTHPEPSSSQPQEWSISPSTPSLVSDHTDPSTPMDSDVDIESDTSHTESPSPAEPPPLFESTYSFFGTSEVHIPSQSATSATAVSPTPSTPTPTTETSGSLRRPPLPAVTLPPSGSPSPAIAPSRGRTPLGSPNLATYRAPEDLRAELEEPGYFGRSLGRGEGFGNITSFASAGGSGHGLGRDAEGREKDADANALMRAERAHFFPLPEGEDDADDEGSAGTHEELMDDYRQWLADEGHDAEDPDAGAEPDLPLQERAAGDAGVDAAQEGAAGEAQGRAADANDEVEANLEDDMDAAFEAIGLRGPFYAVLQNAALMIVILDTSIGLGVFVPFLIGKVTALLSLDPKRFLQILHLPLQLIRLVTDPVVDFAMVLASQLVVSPMIWAATATSRATLHFMGVVIGESRVDHLVANAEKLLEVGLNISLRLKDQAAEIFSSKAPSVSAEPTPSLLESLVQSDSRVLRVIEPYFAPLGHNVRVSSKEAMSTWIRFALGNGPNEKAFAVALGYTIIGLLLAIYLNILTVGSVKSAGRAVRSAVRQQLLVLKVAIFIMIELVVFPLGCGVMLDICSVWLLQQGTVRSRGEFLIFAPLTAIFYHWVIGTMFMYQFAVALAGCRKIMRPGAMWFIKDPQDQNFHPIRDILERPAVVQIRKLLMSALMYGVVVAAGVGTVSALLRLFSRTIMPFRWKIREPLSPVPVDLVFLHVVLPYTLQYFRPKRALRQVGAYVWKRLAHQLRLTSYMFGGRHPSEEFTPKHRSWHTLFETKPEIELDDAENLRDGNFRRVPNTDNIMLVKNSPATVVVDEDGSAIDEQAAELIAAQDAEAEKAKRSIKDDYTIVYLPPHFRYRVIAFVVCIWVIAALMLASVLAMPVLIGRHFFNLFISADVHDGYSFIAGFYLLWGCWIAASAVDRLDKRRQRFVRHEPRAQWPLYITKRALLWIAKTCYMVATLGVIVPALVGLVIELYIIYPIRHTLNPAMEPRIRIVDMWALGMIYVKIILRVLRAQRGQGMMRGIERIRRNGWTHPDPIRATKEVIAPVTVGLLGMVVLPAVGLWSIRKLLPLPFENDALLVHVYPGIFTVAGFAHAAVALSKLVATWSQNIRDKEFLMEMRLRNLEPDMEQEAKSEIEQGEEDDGEEAEEEDEQ